MKLSDNAKAKMYECGIPEYMHGGIVRYYENGIPPGGFLSAVIDNNLREAAGRADAQNQQALIGYVTWFYNYAPGGTWGYQGAVDDYLRAFHDQRDAEVTAGLDSL